MKKILLVMIVVVCLVGCGASTTKTLENKIDPQTEQVDMTDISKKLYDELFRIIDLNDAGKMPDDEFKPQADKLKKQIDMNERLLTDIEKKEVKAYGNNLLNDLVLRKMARDN